MNPYVQWQTQSTVNNPAGIQSYGTTPFGPCTLTQDQMNAYQNTGAFYNTPTSVWRAREYGAAPPNLTYNFHDPVYVAWTDPATYQTQQAKKLCVEENIASWVKNSHTVSMAMGVNITPMPPLYGNKSWNSLFLTT